IDANTVAVLLEPIQGEAGVITAPEGYLRRVREICTEQNVLFVADEIQSGVGRTGTTFACGHEGARPDRDLLGKAAGAGVVPVPAAVGRRGGLGVSPPGEHGRTCGGTPLACAAARAVVQMLADGSSEHRATGLGRYLFNR